MIKLNTTNNGDVDLYQIFCIKQNIRYLTQNAIVDFTIHNKEPYLRITSLSVIDLEKIQKIADKITDDCLLIDLSYPIVYDTECLSTNFLISMYHHIKLPEGYHFSRKGTKIYASLRMIEYSSILVYILDLILQQYISLKQNNMLCLDDNNPKIQSWQLKHHGGCLYSIDKPIYHINDVYSYINSNSKYLKIYGNFSYKYDMIAVSGYNATIYEDKTLVEIEDLEDYYNFLDVLE